MEKLRHTLMGQDLLEIQVGWMWGSRAQHTVSPCLDSFIHSFSHSLESARLGPGMAGKTSLSS